MEDVNGVYEIELAGGDALNIPRRIEVERVPLQHQVGVLLCELTLSAAPEKCVRFCNEVAFYPRENSAVSEGAQEGFTSAASAGADF